MPFCGSIADLVSLQMSSSIDEQNAIQKRVFSAIRIIEATVNHMLWLGRFGSDTVGAKNPAQ